MEGKVFKQRYQLRDKLGSGRLADVYAADDLQLNQRVVVKVIYPEIASDASYIQRLEAESRIASGLDNPHITRTLDWGREDDLYFVVTEYIKGRSLREFLSSDGIFPANRAARVASDVCEALQLAHSRGLVQGGLSTHNIFIDEIGQVKLMDVGMAWTATGRGTPQYISPEQAQGLAVDARSDIYALGIVLYEMLTGKVPFDDPDYQSVVTRQINEEPVAPSVINPAIPAELNALIMKALAKNPAFRFQSAREMRDGLLRFLEGAAVPAPAAAPREAGKSSHTGAWVAAAIIGILIIAGVVLAIVFTGGGGEEAVTVPNLVGMTEDQARDTLDEAGLKMQKESEYITSESQQTGVVVEQDPTQGASLNKGESVTVKISDEMRIPNVVGQTQSEAESTLKKQQVTVIEVSKTPVTDSTQVGKVVQQDPPGGSLISPDTRVTLEIGEEAETVEVPDVVGLSQDNAETSLKNAGFLVKVQEQNDPTIPSGDVISQSPAANQEAGKGSTVTIVVSKGPSV
jgi:serine/threonine protein kinase